MNKGLILGVLLLFSITIVSANVPGCLSAETLEKFNFDDCLNGTLEKYYNDEIGCISGYSCDSIKHNCPLYDLAKDACKEGVVDLKHNETGCTYKCIKNGKFLGLFKIKVEMISKIDSEIGEETLSFKKPWWAFLASGI